MRLLYYYLLFVLIFGSVCVRLTEGTVYHVKPVNQLISCPGNSSCPPGQLCHTMDYLAEHSSEFFSPDHGNVTLIFMCGVHNYTKELVIQSLHSFIMKGAAESRENVIIDHQFVDKPKCRVIQFFDVSYVNITTLTMRCPAIKLKKSHITVKSSNLYGYPSINETLSFISITGRRSHALLDNCTFKENCFIRSDFSDGIIVSNSTFQSYRHQFYSIIFAASSVVTLIGYVNFTDSSTVGDISPIYSSGTAVYLETTHDHSKLKSSLNIKTGAIVYFVNLTSVDDGGAVYGDGAMMRIDAKARVIFMNNTADVGGGAVHMHGYKSKIHIGAKARVVFMYNSADDGGAMSICDGMITLDAESCIIFIYNHAIRNGGALWLQSVTLIVDRKANLSFSHNSADFGGALKLWHSTVHVHSNGIEFYDNRAPFGGAIYFIYGTMVISTNKSLKFVMNSAQMKGGAIYIQTGVRPAIIVGNYSKLLFFNNTAFQGGALYNMMPSLLMTTVGYQSSIQFINNTAFYVGGAVYSQSSKRCIFMITDYSAKISFTGNYAQCGVGHHMYGASIRDTSCSSEEIKFVNGQGKPHCSYIFEKPKRYVDISFDPGLNETLSPVSSAPQRVCLCDSNGKPQCANISYIFRNISIYRGETITLPACIVGYDFGTTVGTIYARFLYSDFLSKRDKFQLVIDSEKCVPFNYTVHSNLDYELLLLQTSSLPVADYFSNESTEYDIFNYENNIKNEILIYFSHKQSGCIKSDLLTTPIFINITLLPGCPPGLTLNHDETTCSCYPVLANNGFSCLLKNRTGLLQWNGTVWMNATFNEGHSTGIMYNRFCPLLYCKSGNKTVNIGDDPSEQCASNRISILCGACKDSFSLAIGSSRCIECPNSHNMALLLAFAAAGVLLVFFILTLDLTVTQGLINGVIFYANIVWAYKIILFPADIGANYLFTFLQAFIVWLNLDFGIETCFFVGLDAYRKTWLQFLFPFYIWAIAGVIIVACRYSFRLTNLIGSRAVPLLATLFLLSYMKLLRTVIDVISVAVIAQYPQNTSFAVWYLDGNLRYCQHPHIYLFLAAIATFIFLWLPYTLVLLFIQPLRRVSHLRPLKWINKLAPVHDAYFSPLKDKHRYWFGALLLVRGILLVQLTVTSVDNPELNVFALFLFITCLFFFISIENVYKRVDVRVLENAILLNLIVLSAGTLYRWESTDSRSKLLIVSTGITFAQFCAIVVWSLIKPCLSAGWRCRRNQGNDIIDNDDIAHERIEDPELEPLIK